MPPSWINYHWSSTLPEHCEPSSTYLRYISSSLGICLPTPLALISSTLGTLSIVSWLFAQLPQIYKNFCLKSTVGLSPLFLVEWLLGDTTNLVGAIFTNQAGWQITIASYYVLVDMTLVVQFYWYTYIRNQRSTKLSYITIEDGEEDPDMYNGILPSETSTMRQPSPAPSAQTVESKNGKNRGVDPIQVPSRTNSPYLSNEKRNKPARVVGGTGLSVSGTTVVSPRSVLLVSMLCAVLANAATSSPDVEVITGAPVIPHESATQIVGRVASWMSTFLYLGSRLPQLFKNHRRKSTSGLSGLLFFAAFCGNFFYSASLLANPNAWNDFPPYGAGGWAGPEGNDRLEWISRALPFFLGAAGVLAMDAAMGVQFALYREKHKHEELVVGIRDSARGRRRWKKVTGWMRGWVPTASPERQPLLANDAVRTYQNHRARAGV